MLFVRFAAILSALSVCPRFPYFTLYYSLLCLAVENETGIGGIA